MVGVEIYYWSYAINKIDCSIPIAARTILLVSGFIALDEIAQMNFWKRFQCMCLEKKLLFEVADAKLTLKVNDGNVLMCWWKLLSVALLINSLENPQIYLYKNKQTSKKNLEIHTALFIVSWSNKIMFKAS